MATLADTTGQTLPAPDHRDRDAISIAVRNVSKCYHIYDKPQDRLKQTLFPRLHRLAHLFRNAPPLHYYREFWALNDVSFEVKRGESLGIIGRNGAGKSTLLQLIAGTLTPTSGTAPRSPHVESTHAIIGGSSVTRCSRALSPRDMQGAKLLQNH